MNIVCRVIGIIVLLCSLSTASFAQIDLKGSIIDAETGETMIGANVIIKGTTTGTVTDMNGDFKITVPKLPATLVFSFIGYNQQELVVTDATAKIKIKLATNSLVLDQVEIVDTRVSEKQQQAALTVEAMDVIAVKEAASGNFYESLGTLKGVDVTSASLGFKVVNTRGFNSTSPVRTLQLIDGVDNQSPGLNFSLGNFLGASDLDVMKVDIVAGASSAFYGPGAFNGVIAMTTKDPFLFQGLDASIKFGERNMMEYAIRWAKAYKNKEGRDIFAYKLNLFYMQALDWQAENYAPTEDSKTDENNPGGYDAVNVYGDEALNGGNDFSGLYNLLNSQGLGTIYRTGYKEKDVVDYHTNNFKTGVSLHYKPTSKVEVIYAANYGTGSTVYQGDNRYRLDNIQFLQNRIEVRNKDKWFIRAYATHEDAGDSYDAVLTAFILNNQAKADGDWYQQYYQYWRRTGGPAKTLAKFPDFPKFKYPADLDSLDYYVQAYEVVYQEFLDTHRDTLMTMHAAARADADTNATGQFVPRYEPGTARYDSAYADVTSRLFTDGGSKLFDRSALYHIHGEYKFQPKWAEIITGANFRLYKPNSRGTIFSDSLVNPFDTLEGGIRNPDGEYHVITNYEYGAYVGAERKLLKDKLKLTATIRMDKNKNFNYIFSPAVSAVYTTTKNHVFRVSFSSALRNPTLADQYLYYRVGRAILLGNLEGKDSLVTVDSFRDYINTTDFNLDTLVYFNVAPVKPEQVRTIEFGYRGTVFKKVYVDAGYYFSVYQNFIGYNLGIDLELSATGIPTPSTIAYRVAANAKGITTTQGAMAGINYYFHKKYALSANYSWNKLILDGKDDQIIPAFNTPEHKFNVGINGRDLRIPFTNAKHFGFNANYKWIQGFQFTGSPQFTGFVPSYALVDAQANYFFPGIKTTVRIGASNLLNNQVYQVYGGPYVGRLAYFSVLYELGLK